MTSTESRGTADPEARGRPTARAVLVAAAVLAWIATVAWSRDMGNGTGTMGLGWAEFLVVWTVMMAAMMLPSVWTVAGRRHASDSTPFATGYLLVWAAAGLPALALAVGAERLTDQHPAVATGVAAAIFGTCGLYQFTPAKARFLARCQLAWPEQGSVTDEGAIAALRRGVAHGACCFGCSWAAMALLIAFGVMNVGAMVVLAVLILAERSRIGRKSFTRVAGMASIACALLVVIHPQIAPGLHHAVTMMPM